MYRVDQVLVVSVSLARAAIAVIVLFSVSWGSGEYPSQVPRKALILKRFARCRVVSVLVSHWMAKIGLVSRFCIKTDPILHPF